jgi:hypothetical protein
MTTHAMETGYDLERAQILTLRIAAGTTITCARGLVWITQAGRREDFWLPAGETLRVTRTAKVVIEAAQASRIGTFRALGTSTTPLQAATAWLAQAGQRLWPSSRTRPTVC